MHGYEVDNRLDHSATKRDIYSSEILKKLPWLKRATVKTVIKLYCACSRLREDTRMSMITSIWLVRRVVYEIARRLVEQGVLRSIDDVQYLDFSDIQQYVYGYEEASVLFSFEKIKQQKDLYRSYTRAPGPPLTFIGYASSIPSKPIDKNLCAFSGLGTSSGQVVARARVISDLVQQAPELQRGEIIVAEFTDASWTPLFSIAGGIITDVGSMLSHSSIVAREFGIPSVVNTKLATGVIKTGDLVQFDGITGEVVILEKVGV